MNATFLSTVILTAVAEKPQPSGSLYAACMTKGVTLPEYEQALGMLKKVGAVTEKNYLIEATRLGRVMANEIEKLIKERTV